MGCNDAHDQASRSSATHKPLTALDTRLSQTMGQSLRWVFVYYSFLSTSRSNVNARPCCRPVDVVGKGVLSPCTVPFVFPCPLPNSLLACRIRRRLCPSVKHGTSSSASDGVERDLCWPFRRRVFQLHENPLSSSA